MKMSFRLHQLLGPDASRRGIIRKIARETGIERHTISAILHNKVTTVNLEIVARLCDFLIRHKYAPAEILPGALLGRDPERFWDLLAGCQRLEFCVGTRKAKEWPRARYVIAADSHLQNVLHSKISQLKYSSRNGTNGVGGVDVGDGSHAPPLWAPTGGNGYLSAFHQVPAPARNARANEPGRGWNEICREAQRVYRTPGHYTEQRALITMGSTKVNPVVEVMLARAFHACPFFPQDEVPLSRDRLCPIFFRYRGNDPQPPSCCGGRRLSEQEPEDRPGICHEQADGHWHFSPCDARHDVAFLYYCNRRPAGMVEVACGGFSARATGLFTEHLDGIASQLGDPQYEASDLHLALYVIQFTQRNGDPAWEFQVIPVAEQAIRRRLESGHRSNVA